MTLNQTERENMRLQLKEDWTVTEIAESKWWHKKGNHPVSGAFVSIETDGLYNAWPFGSWTGGECGLKSLEDAREFLLSKGSDTPWREVPTTEELTAAARIAELAASNERLQIKLHKASAMVARLKRASNARPESPAYYNQNNVDCADIVNAYNLSYWDGGAVVHILRAGHKPGETRLQALENALACLRHAVSVERAK